MKADILAQWIMFEFWRAFWVVLLLARILLLPPRRPLPWKGPPRQLCHGPWPIGHGPWQSWLGRLVVIRRNLPSDRVIVDCGKAFLLFWNGGSSNQLLWFCKMFSWLSSCNITMFHTAHTFQLDVSILLLLTNRHNKGILLHFCQQNGKKSQN